MFGLSVVVADIDRRRIVHFQESSLAAHAQAVVAELALRLNAMRKLGRNRETVGGDALTRRVSGGNAEYEVGWLQDFVQKLNGIFDSYHGATFINNRSRRRN